VPLNTKLQNGQRVEILTSKHGSPSRDWLNASLGYLQSASARAKVRHWFKYQHFEENVAQGRTKLDRELHRAGVGAINQEKIAQKLQFNKLEDFLAAIGRGDVSEHQIALAIQEEVAPGVDDVPKITSPRRSSHSSSQTGVVVEGVGNLQTTTAKCCKPMPPDAIVGYLTRDHGVTIHREVCAFVARLPESRHNRLLAAKWGQHQVTSAEVGIEVEAHDRQGLLRDISDLLYREKVNAMQANTMTRNHFALMQFTLQVGNREQLSRLMGLIGRIPSVIAVRRRV
jgi:GTP pyrophosphokinase